jgi:hypothetical protein
VSKSGVFCKSIRNIGSPGRLLSHFFRIILALAVLGKVCGLPLVRGGKPDPGGHGAAPSAPKATQAELVRTEKTEPEKQNKSSERQLAASPPTEQSPEQPNIAEEVRQYVALGGPLGGGFAAPPVDTNVLGYDWTAPFRERVGMCSKLDGVEPADKVSIKIRISFKRDGTPTPRKRCRRWA